MPKAFLRNVSFSFFIIIITYHIICKYYGFYLLYDGLMGIFYFGRMLLADAALTLLTLSVLLF